MGLVKTICIRTPGKGLHEITSEVQRVVASSKSEAGLCTVFIQHTSASLIIQENADPSARRDLETWLERLVPEHDRHFTHLLEGPDDMPAHIKAALTATSLSIPFQQHRLMLGQWQGIYVWEHRAASHLRSVVIQLCS